MAVIVDLSRIPYRPGIAYGPENASKSIYSEFHSELSKKPDAQVQDPLYRANGKLDDGHRQTYTLLAQ